MSKKFLTGMAVLLSASLFFFGCGDTDDPEGGGPSSNAGLGTQAVVKGVNVDFSGTGTGAAFATPVTGTAIVAASAFSNAALTTAFTAADSGTSKAVYVAPGSVAGYTEANFNDATAYADATAIAAGGVFFVKVTSEDSTNVKWYKVTVLENVLSVYTLMTTEDAPDVTPEEDTESGLTILSASKDASGAVTIKLGGTLAASFVYTADGETDYEAGTDPAADFPSLFWMGEGDSATPAAGKYANAYIKGLFSGLEEDNTKFIAVKQTNQALRFFTDGKAPDDQPSPGITTDVLEGPKTADAEGAIYLPADTTIPSVRWRVYNSGAKTPDEIFGMLIYAGTLSPKTAVFDITERQDFTEDAEESTSEDRYSATITVDYSAVDFGS
jgi:hypothetical protein